MAFLFIKELLAQGEPAVNYQFFKTVVRFPYAEQTDIKLVLHSVVLFYLLTCLFFHCPPTPIRNTISKNVKGSRGAILTTHSMEEADALCSRVGIMVKGQLK